MSFTRLPLFHRTPCFQRDFGKRTKPLSLPRALSTENGCSRTWRSKRLSTRTEKTLYHLQGKRKVQSVFVSVLSYGPCRHRHPPLPGLGVEYAGTTEAEAVAVQLRSEAQESGQALSKQRKRWSYLLCLATLEL